MAAETANIIKIPADIEYKVIGNAFGLLIASGGLLAGAMMSEGSLAYWQDDLVPLGLSLFLGFRLMRTFVTTMIAYQGVAPRPPAAVSRENIQRVHATVAQLPAAKGYTPEEVVAEVARRIEAQKANAAKKKQ